MPSCDAGSLDSPPKLKKRRAVFPPTETVGMTAARRSITAAATPAAARVARASGEVRLGSKRAGENIFTELGEDSEVPKLELTPGATKPKAPSRGRTMTTEQASAIASTQDVLRRIC